MEKLSKDFYRSEFSCSCGCNFDDVDNYHVEKLQEVRDKSGVPMVINSGCRCTEHNEAIGGADNSDHLTGEGSDIKVKNGRERFLICRAAIEVGINRIGIAKTFIHLGTSVVNDQKVLWVY